MHLIPLAVNGILLEAFWTSDFFGKSIFIALFFLSILTWCVLLQKALHYTKVRKSAQALQDLLQKSKENILLIPVPQENTPFANIYFSLKNKTVEILDKNLFFHKKHSPQAGEEMVFLSPSDVEWIETHAATSITKEAKTLERNLFILSTTVSLAPFLGILGTVWGILISLGELQSGGSIQSNSLLLAGLSTALATTVLGLVIAIPALIAHNYLKNFLRSFFTDMENFTGLLISTIEIQYRRVELR